MGSIGFPAYSPFGFNGRFLYGRLSVTGSHGLRRGATNSAPTPVSFFSLYCKTHALRAPRGTADRPLSYFPQGARKPVGCALSSPHGRARVK